MSTRALARITTLSLFAVALTLLIALSSGTAHAAGSFNPVGTICLDDQSTIDPNPLKPGIGKPMTAKEECDGSNAPGANVALTSSFGVGLGADGESQQGSADDTPDYNFGLNVSFTPPEWGVAKGTDIPHGAVVGTLNSNATLGLLGNPCRSPVLVPFTFVNASINPADTIVPKPPGAKDRLEPLNLDANGNGIPDGADKWPSYLNEIDAFKNVKPSQIRARMFGVNATAVANLTIVLNFVIFEPGADLSDAQGKLLDIDPRLGYLSVTVLQDPSAAASSDDSVSDFCSPLHSATTTYGVTEDNPNTSPNEGGKPNRTNPSCDTTCSYIAASAPQRDADGDGIENGLDPCPLTPDPNWNPRGPAYQPGADNDADGLPNSCDPKPDIPSDIVIKGFDEDRDQWINRHDNCPLIKNGPSEENVPGVGNNDDEDSDGIGDACDPHPNDADAEGDPKSVATVNNLTIGAGGTAPIKTGTYRDVELEDLEQLLGPGCSCDGGGPGGTTVPPKKVQEKVKAGETVTTDKEGDGATADDPVEASVTSPIGDTISIEITDISVTPPQGFQFLNGSRQVEISAPDATPEDPLIVVFQLDFTIIPGGEDENTIQVFKDGVQVGECSGDSGTASPDPCVSDRALLADGDVELTVLTSTASSWNFGVAGTTVAGETTGPDGGAATGVGSLAPAVSSIPAWAAIASALGGAGLLGSLGAFLARFVRRRRY